MNTRNIIGAVAITMLIMPVLTQAQETEQMTAEERRAHTQSLPESERQAQRDSKRAEPNAKRAETQTQRESMTDEQRQASRDAKRSQSDADQGENRARREPRTNDGREAQRNQKQRTPGARSNGDGRGQKGGDRQRNRSTT